MKIKSNFLKIAVLSILPVALTGCGSKTVDVNKYIDFEYTGYNTVGSAVYTIDIETLVDENQEAFDLDDDSSEKAFDKVVERLSEELTGSAENITNLSNGDKIAFKWDDVDVEKLEERYPVKLNISDIEFTVEGLEEPEMFNPFDYVTVVYEGIAPNGYASINVDSDIPVKGISFEMDNYSKLSNGDTIKVTAEGSYDDIDSCCLEYGMKAEETENTYTVEGLSSYAMSLDEIPEDTLTKLDKHAMDTLNAHVAKKWSDASSFVGAKLVGNYFLFPKDSSLDAYTNNYLYFVYEVTAKSMDSKKEFKYYYHSYYTDIMILDDGTCSFDLGSLSTTDTTFNKENYYYYGYESLDTLFNKQVTARIDTYDYESTVE